MSNIEAAQKSAPLYPIRIGINTAYVYVGDLGGTKKIEFTVIGHGVNYAKRLESACDPHCIMIGEETKKLLPSTPIPNITLEKRYIQIKHHADLLEAYEVDPFRDNHGVRLQALAAFRHFQEAKRKERRWTTSKEQKLKVVTDHGKGLLVNFSQSGFTITLDKYLAVGVIVHLRLDSEDSAFCKKLEAAGLMPLTCEVRWGKPGSPKSFFHGLLIKNLNASQKKALSAELRKVASVKVAA